MYFRYWNPLREIEEFQRQIDRVFQRVSPWTRRGYPPIELVDAGDQFILRALLPGISLEELKLSVSGTQVALSGSKPIKSIEGAKVIRRERVYGQFHRIIELPEAVDTDRVRAEYKEGVLHLYLPKARAAAPVTILIESSRGS